MQIVFSTHVLMTSFLAVQVLFAVQKWRAARNQVFPHKVGMVKNWYVDGSLVNRSTSDRFGSYQLWICATQRFRQFLSQDLLSSPVPWSLFNGHCCFDEHGSFNATGKVFLAPVIHKPHSWMLIFFYWNPTSDDRNATSPSCQPKR